MVRNTPGQTPTSNGRRYVTIAEAAKYLAVNPNTIRKMTKEGTLTEYRAGNRIVRVDLNEIDAVMDPPAPQRVRLVSSRATR